MGQRRDNPNLRTFGYQDKYTKDFKTYRPIAGNSRKDEQQNFKLIQSLYFLDKITSVNQKYYSFSDLFCLFTVTFLKLKKKKKKKFYE